MARFQREAEVLASLNHPNIAAIYGVEERALVMELVEGTSPKGPLPFEEAWKLAAQIVAALEYAHDKGIIHRDLKPANILVTPEGPRASTVKLLDFGLAKAFSNQKEPSASAENSPTLTLGATEVGVILGTAAYMSPEQARGKVVDKRADIWSFGVVLYELLTGERLFGGEDAAEILAAVIHKQPDLTKVPQKARRLLEDCLQKDPRQRLRDIGDAKRLLGEHVAAVGAAPASRLGMVAWGVAALAIVYALGVSFLHFREMPEARPLVRFTAPPPPDAIRHVMSGFAISPDGQLLAFRAGGSDRVFRIFVRHIDTAEAQPLAGTESGTDSTSVFWAPDSRSLAFAREGGLYRSDLSAGPPKRLCDVPGNSFYGGTWSPGGVIVFGAHAGLFRVPDTGGTPTPVATLDAAAKEAGHFGPWFLPDGKHLLFLALATGQTRGTIWAASIDNPARTRITESSGAAAYAAGWLLSSTPNPRSLLAQPFDPERLKLQGTPQPVRDRLPMANTGGIPGFAVSANGTLVVDRPAPVMSQLTWMDRTGRAVATLGPRANIASFALAPDERRAVAEIRDTDAGKIDLWLFDAGKESGTRVTFGEPTMRPLWAIDGRHVYVTQSDATQRQLSTLTIGAPAATAFENPGPFVHFEDVTRDGRYLVFKSVKAPSEIWIQRVGSAERRALVQGPFAAVQARVSPDSRWLAYGLALPSGPEVFAQPFDRPGERIQVSVKGGSGPVWRDDGRELYYEGPEGLMAVPVTERNGSLEAGTPRMLFSIHTQGLVSNQPHNVEVAAHGQKFLVNSIAGGSDNVPLEVTLNWTAALKK